MLIKEIHSFQAGRGGALPKYLLTNSLGLWPWPVEHQKKMTIESSWNETTVDRYNLHIELAGGSVRARDSSVHPRADRISIRRWTTDSDFFTSRRDGGAWEEKPLNKLMFSLLQTTRTDNIPKYCSPFGHTQYIRKFPENIDTVWEWNERKKYRDS